MSKNMTDFIIAVENSQQWHQNNLEVHPHHYSGLAKISGAKKVAWLQDGWGAKFYFNTLVPWRDKGRIKYGIISSQNLGKVIIHNNFVGQVFVGFHPCS